MPSDPRATQALDALSTQIESFRSILANTSEQIRLMISTRVERNGSSVAVARAELGEFAAGRIDADLMAKLFARTAPPKIGNGDVVRRALDVCNQLLARREDLFRVVVEEGTDLRTAVASALTEIGRAFAATRIVELVTQGAYQVREHQTLLDGHPFENWSRSERSVDLALVVCVAGRDLRVGGLADFLDCSIKLVLVVDGEAPPASLVRLITPKVLVIQTTDSNELERIGRHDGPGVMALMSDGAAQFRHDPAGGSALADRIVITELPAQDPHQLGCSSVFQQQEDLAQLAALAAVPEASAHSSPGTPVVDASEDDRSSAAPEVEISVVADPRGAPPTEAVDKLSGWLLDQIDLTGPS